MKKEKIHQAATIKEFEMQHLTEAEKEERQYNQIKKEKIICNQK